MSNGWADALKKYNEDKVHKTPGENDREADIEFIKLLEAEKKEEEEKNISYKAIPKFFFKKPSESSLYFRVRQEARTRFLQNKTAEVLDKEGVSLFMND
jgi:serine/threonine-protein phosphatase 2A regulatory subunit B''